MARWYLMGTSDKKSRDRTGLKYRKKKGVYQAWGSSAVFKWLGRDR